jgi:hypothetical protein
MAQKNNLVLGAYYFDGWTGTYPIHLTKSLVDSFSSRKPKWGWITSTQEIVDQQIIEASNAGLSFFSFCWFYNGKDKYKQEPLNRALNFYLNSKDRNRLKYCLLITNQVGFHIRPKDWPIITTELIRQFKSGTYLTVNKMPLLVIYSMRDLINTFGSPNNVHNALDSLRSVAQIQGLGGVVVAVCEVPDLKNIEMAEKCGFDIITGYNYHNNLVFTPSRQDIPIDSMQMNERVLWDRIPSMRSSLKFIPVSTLNWDPRPWATSSNKYMRLPYFTGYSSASVYQSVKGMLSWIQHHKESVTYPEMIGLLYAWNEYGEGGYLTPSANGDNMLDGVKRALNDTKGY